MRPNGGIKAPSVRLGYFNKLVVFESLETQFAGNMNQSLEAEFLVGIFERLPLQVEMTLSMWCQAVVEWR
jgi:hypothetical protein